jgi:hypothetical protein
MRILSGGDDSLARAINLSTLGHAKIYCEVFTATVTQFRSVSLKNGIAYVLAIRQPVEIIIVMIRIHDRRNSASGEQGECVAGFTRATSGLEFICGQRPAAKTEATSRPAAALRAHHRARSFDERIRSDMTHSSFCEARHHYA